MTNRPARSSGARALPLALALLVSSIALAQEKLTPMIDRGLESSVQVRYAPTLRERSGATRATPIRVRVSPTDEPGVQRISYIGNVAGEFDLRDFLAREDGQPLRDMPTLPVTVLSHLPRAHGLDLFEGESWQSRDEAWSWRRHYRLLMLTGLAFWLAVPIVALTRWAIRRPRPQPAPPPQAPPPTLGEQLTSAIRHAGVQPLTVDERAALELLLIRTLSEELGLAMVPQHNYAATLESLRHSPRTAAVVRAVEHWLHAAGDPSAREASGARALDLLAQLARKAQPDSSSATVLQPAGSTA